MHFVETSGTRLHHYKNVHLVWLFSEIVYDTVYIKRTFVIYKTCKFITTQENLI